MKKLNKLDRYKLKLKIKETGKIAWSVLIKILKIQIFLFLLITAILFWQFMALNLSTQGIDLLKPISQMILIIIMAVILITIDELKKLSIK